MQPGIVMDLDILEKRMKTRWRVGKAYLCILIVLSQVASGEWKEDWLHGKGISVDPDGNTFVGEFKDGKKHGKGVLTWRDGSVIRGEWKHGKVSGFAVCKYCSANGFEFEYSGEWKMGKMHGQGIMRFVEGTMYKGKFRNGYFCGHGVLTLSNGEEIEKECWTMDDLKNYYVEPVVTSIYSLSAVL